MNNIISTLVRNLVILGAAVALCGCATTKRDWQEANREGTIQAYEQFLEKHPDADQADEATHKLGELRSERDWENAESANTISGFREFLKKHPESEYASKAKQKLQAELDAQQRAKIRTWNLNTACDYLDKHPNGRFLKDVLETIKKRNLATVLKKHSLIASAVKLGNTNEVEVVNSYVLEANGPEPVKVKMRAKVGKIFVAVACNITHFGSKQLFKLDASRIYLVQSNGIKCETIAQYLLGASKSDETVSDESGTQFLIDGTATVLITSEVPISSQKSVMVSLMGNVIPVAPAPPFYLRSSYYRYMWGLAVRRDLE